MRLNTNAQPDCPCDTASYHIPTADYAAGWVALQISTPYGQPTLVWHRLDEPYPSTTPHAHDGAKRFNPLPTFWRIASLTCRQNVFALSARGVRDADWDGLQGANRSHSRCYGEDLQRRRPPKSAPARPRRDRKHVLRLQVRTLHASAATLCALQPPEDTIERLSGSRWCASCHGVWAVRATCSHWLRHTGWR